MQGFKFVFIILVLFDQFQSTDIFCAAGAGPGARVSENDIFGHPNSDALDSRLNRFYNLIKPNSNINITRAVINDARSTLKFLGNENFKGKVATIAHIRQLLNKYGFFDKDFRKLSGKEAIEELIRKIKANEDLLNAIEKKLAAPLPGPRSASSKDLQITDQIKKMILIGDIKALKKFLIAESKNINNEILKNVLKYTRDQLDQAYEKKDGKNIEKFNQIVELFESEPIRQHLRPYFPEEISGIIEGYYGRTKKNIEDQIEEQIRKMPTIYSGRQLNPTSQISQDRLIQAKIKKYKKNLHELNNLELNKKIKLLKYFNAKIKSDSYFHSKKFPSPERLGNLPFYNKILGEIMGINYERQPLLINEFEEKNYIQTFNNFELSYLFYKYLYLLLDEKEIKENNIESPEELKNFVQRIYDKDALKDL